jgi:regulator of sirC expression with transglutaminase-like and TPR domain
MEPSAYCRPAAYAAFRRELPQIETTRGLFRAAFAISQHERTTAVVEVGEQIIDNLSDSVERRLHSKSPHAKLAHLHDVLFEVVGLHGNTDDYYNPANSYLPDVLDSHQGLPITLVLIYKCVAEGIGLTVHGVNAPGHFLAAVENPDVALGGTKRSSSAWMYVDPFYGGGVLHEQDVFQRIAETTGRDVYPSPELLAHATGRQWLVRMLANLQAVFAHLGRERDLLAMQELAALLGQTGRSPSGGIE